MRSPYLALTLILAFLAACTASGPTLTVQVDQPGIKVSPTLYGIFFEEINRSGDGGIVAEMVQNRSFEDTARPGVQATEPLAWSFVQSRAAQGSMQLDESLPLNPQSPHALRLTVTNVPTGGRVGVANDGFLGATDGSRGMAVRKNAQYLLSLYARTSPEQSLPPGLLRVSLENSIGAVLASAPLPALSSAWQKVDLVLTPNDASTAARLVLAATAPATCYFDMVSLTPMDNWKNSGLRTDLMQYLADLKPAFVRFPGGCWVEGETLATAQRWKQTIGDPAQRRTQWNLWNYCSTNALGYHEYLQMCEDLRAEPLFVINSGMSHQEQRSQSTDLSRIDEFVQDALDAVEYANGPVDSTWGSLRAKAGHPAPFNLKYVEIGNENGGAAYNARYALIYNALKSRYPGLHLIANLWNGTPDPKMLEIVDEHYYLDPVAFMAMATKYDKYDRKGPRVYVGEYAVTKGCGEGNLIAALGEAAFMTGLERNSDVVTLASYAPLLANVHYKAWNPNAINFDNARTYGTPSYYVQQMFARNRADLVLPVQLQTPNLPPPPADDRRGAVGVGTWLSQVEFKDLTVTNEGETLFAADLSKGLAPWKTSKGQWSVQDGVIRQANPDDYDVRATIGDPTWTDYTLNVKARKTAGTEGFLVFFHVRDSNNLARWNLGGWNNTAHAVQIDRGGGRTIVEPKVPGMIETGRWYDIRIEVKGDQVRCFLDGQLIHDVSYPAPPVVPALYAVAGRSADEVILKVVNASATPQDTQVNLRGITGVSSAGTAVVLTSGTPGDENSLDQPTRVAPATHAFTVSAPVFRYTFPPCSVNVLRINITK